MADTRDEIKVIINNNNEIHYEPGNQVSSTGTVTFQLMNIPGTVMVCFDQGNSCLQPRGILTMHGGRAQMASFSYPVDPNTCSGVHSFTVYFRGGGLLMEEVGADHETKKGGIDVTTDPGEDPRDKKRE